MEFNKDHDHDYEQIQIHLDMETRETEKIIASSVGGPEHAGHGIEVYKDIAEVECRDAAYTTLSETSFP